MLQKGTDFDLEAKAGYWECKCGIVLTTEEVEIKLRGLSTASINFQAGILKDLAHEFTWKYFK